MKEVLIVGSGLAGLTCAVSLAQLQIRCTLVSPYPSERAQSIMAAGGINAALAPDDSPALHAADTLLGGCEIASPTAVQRLCQDAPQIIAWLEELGTVFTRDSQGQPELRTLGGHSKKRTAYAGAATGKQIMTALIREVRKYICKGIITQRFGLQFHSGLIQDGRCYGALLYNEHTAALETCYADAVVMATGGQNALFGKTTGSTLCDGYAAARLFQQGALLKNPEFIQYHPTTVETPQKRMLISEAARGEGGRLYYLQDGRRVYFLEDQFGPQGNLMPRDVVSRYIYNAPSQVYLDIASVGKAVIQSRLSEVAQICNQYADLDVTKESIPVYPSVHFFMGGFGVDLQHQTNIQGLYAIGECAAMYHGANRLGGNSLLSAIHSGRIAAAGIGEAALPEVPSPDFTGFIQAQQRILSARLSSQSPFSAMYIRYELAKLMQDCLGICRREEKLLEGIRSVDYYLSISDKLAFDTDVSPYLAYSLQPMLLLARAILTAALERRESRGAHYREDHPQPSDAFCCATLVTCKDGAISIQYEKEV